MAYSVFGGMLAFSPGGGFFETIGGIVVMALGLQLSRLMGRSDMGGRW